MYLALGARKFYYVRVCDGCFYRAVKQNDLVAVFVTLIIIITALCFNEANENGNIGGSNANDDLRFFVK